MGLFTKTTTIAGSGFLSNFTDYHCHILPGVDDGFQKMDESLEVLDSYEKAGITSVWLTPHIMEDIPNTTRDLAARFDDLKAAYKGTVNLNLASENMMDSLFLQRLEANDFLPLPGNRLLVETSYFNPPMDMDRILCKIKSKGYYPVLAHPERYIYMDKKRYEELRGLGVLFQLNIPSLYGSYGARAQINARALLSKGFYSLCATDLHSIASFAHLLESKLKVSEVNMLPR